jgi:hypothetical protein
MLVGIVAVQTANAKVAALRLAAFGIQLLDVDLAHVRGVDDIGLSVFANDGFFVDPPIGVGALDLQFSASVEIDHGHFSPCFFFIIEQPPAKEKGKSETKGLIFETKRSILKAKKGAHYVLLV